MKKKVYKESSNGRKKKANKVTKDTQVGNNKVSKNGRRKKAKELKRSTPPQTLENVRSLRKELDLARGDALANGRGLVAVRAELDQHKARAAKENAAKAKQYVEISKILSDLRRDVDAVASRCQKLEMFDDAMREASDEPEDAPTEVDDLPGYDEQPVLRGSKFEADAKDTEEDFESWAARQIRKLEKNHLEYEAFCKELLIRVERLEKIGRLVPPDGCEVVVRREKR